MAHMFANKVTHASGDKVDRKLKLSKFQVRKKN